MMLTDDEDVRFLGLHLIHRCLTSNSEDSMSVEEFAENVADLKIHILDEIHTAKFKSSHYFPCQYELLERKLAFKRTIAILSVTDPGIMIEEMFLTH